LFAVNAYWPGLSFMWNSLHLIVLPAMLLGFVDDARKNTALGLLTCRPDHRPPHPTGLRRAERRLAVALRTAAPAADPGNAGRSAVPVPDRHCL
jgi:hypothetical protein